MDYPSTTQALFALIVMTIVLAFILVYCCWGTFSCPRPEDIPCNDDRDSLSGGGERSPSSTPPAFFILPYGNMIYVGDGRTQRVFQIPIRPAEDKPPSYTELFANNSSPDFRSCSDPSFGAPPTYDQCFRYGNTAVMLEDSRSTSQINIENVASQSQCILSAADLQVSSNSLRDSSISNTVPVHNSNPKLFTSTTASAVIKNWGRRSSRNGTNSQSTYLPSSLFRLPFNPCCSNPCIPDMLPSLEQYPSVESLRCSSEFSSPPESADRGREERSEEGRDASTSRSSHI